MQLNDAIRMRLKYFLDKKNYSLWDLYKSSGVPKSTINALLSAKTNNIPRIPTLLHLCEGLGTNLQEFFNDEVFFDVEDSSEDKQ